MILKKRIYNTASGIYHLLKTSKKTVKERSYYPNENLKSDITVFIEQLMIILKTGLAESYYFLYGFDRKSMTKEERRKYISPYGIFANKRDKLNLNPPYVRPYNYIILVNDKFVFERYCNSLGLPTPLNKYLIENGVIYDLSENRYIEPRDFITNSHNYFCKPFSGMLGLGIFTLKVEKSILHIDDVEFSLEEFEAFLKKNKNTKFICQQAIKQHEQMAQIYSKSVNTLRIQSVISESGQVTAFGVKARFGANNNKIDNWAMGGVLIGVDLDSGKLHKNGFFKPEFGYQTDKHPNTGFIFHNFEIPFFKEAVELVKKAHKFLYGIHSIGWDVAITSEGPVIIEANHRWEISSTQATHGGMLEFINENFNK